MGTFFSMLPIMFFYITIFIAVIVLIRLMLRATQYLDLVILEKSQSEEPQVNLQDIKIEQE